MMSSSYSVRIFLLHIALFVAGIGLVTHASAQELVEPVETPAFEDLDFLTGEDVPPIPEMETVTEPIELPGVDVPVSLEEELTDSQTLEGLIAEELPEASDMESVPVAVGASTATSTYAAPDPDSPTTTPSSSSEVPSLPVVVEKDENIFFDAEALVPMGEMGTKTGPRKVNPRLQPASKLIVVRKNHESGSREAGLVAAERALKLGRYDSALEMFDKLYQKNKSDPNIIMGRATALQNLGRGEEAILAYEKILDTYPSNVEAEVNMLGLIGQRYPAVALQRLVALRDVEPDNVGIVAQIAGVQAALGNTNDALQYLGIAASMEPQNASHLFNIAVIADRAGKRKEAVKYYEQALELDTVYGGGRSIPRDSVFERLARLR